MKIFKASGERLSGLIFIDTLNRDTDLEPVDDAVPCLMTGKLVHGSPPLHRAWETQTPPPRISAVPPLIGPA